MNRLHISQGFFSFNLFKKMDCQIKSDETIVWDSLLANNHKGLNFL